MPCLLLRWTFCSISSLRLHREDEHVIRSAARTDFLVPLLLPPRSIASSSFLVLSISSRAESRSSLRFTAQTGSTSTQTVRAGGLGCQVKQ
mmetsp:Transcript_8704/g.19744  ORF Transcript_8704/g.19744 Transcript_8704/m.19744 type:complete len:91 (+) Transcript_8704:618-890(+)